MQWRDKYERFLDLRPRLQPLDGVNHYLIEFQYGKFDDIEIPGQYTEVSTQHEQISFTHPTPQYKTGQRQQSKLCSHPKIWIQIRDLPNSWQLLEAVHTSWH